MNRSIRSFAPPAVLNLLIINILFWIAQLTIPNAFNFDLTSYLGLHYWKSSQFNPIQLVTYMFLHDTRSVSHLFFNMFGLWMFGRNIEEIWGTKKFLFFYFVAGIGAAIFQELCWMIDFRELTAAFNTCLQDGNAQALAPFQSLFTGGDITRASMENVISLREQYFSMPLSVGASGALFGILLAFGWLFPQAKMFLLFVPIPIPSRIFVGMYAVAELFLGVFGKADGIAHFAHLGGMIAAAILLFIWHKQHKLY